MVDVIDFVHRTSWKTFGGVMKNWTITWIGNLCGCFFTSYFLSYHTGLFANDPWHHWVISFVEHKAELEWYQVFLRGIGCNILVCMGYFMAGAADDATGKFVCLWFSIFTFASIGYEHCIANMYYFPTAIMYGAHVTWGRAFTNFMVSTFGNIVGAVVFCDLIFWFGFGRLYFRENPLMPAHNCHRHDSRPTDHLPADKIKMNDIVSLMNPRNSSIDPPSAASGSGESGSHCGVSVPMNPYATYSGLAPAGTCSYFKRYVHKDGRVVTARVESNVLRGTDGTPQSLEAHVFLPETPEERGVIVIELTPDGRADHIIFASKSFCDLLGFSEEELRSRPLNSVTHPDDFAISDNAVSRVLKGKANGDAGAALPAVLEGANRRRSSVPMPSPSGSITVDVTSPGYSLHKSVD
eukprot:tig00001208_g7534.t1